MSNDSTFSDGTVPEDADFGPDVAEPSQNDHGHHEKHVAADGQTVDDDEHRLDEGMVSDGETHAKSHDSVGLEHGLGAP
ncbi:MAG: hypothetical protein ACOH1T_12375 [Microbacteriaceae bacterium]